MSSSSNILRSVTRTIPEPEAAGDPSAIVLAVYQPNSSKD